MRDATGCGVYLGTPERFGVDILMRHRFHDIWTGHEHVTGPVDHGDEVGHRGRVDGSPCTWPEDCRDLRDHARRHHIAQKNLGIPAQGSHAFLNPGATGVIETNDWRAAPDSKVHDLADFLCEGL